MGALFACKEGGVVADVKELAEIDYLAGMKYKDIAAKYNVSLNTVKSWQKRYGWSRKRVHPKKQKGCTRNEHHQTAICKEKKQTLKSS